MQFPISATQKWGSLSVLRWQGGGTEWGSSLPMGQWWGHTGTRSPDSQLRASPHLAITPASVPASQPASQPGRSRGGARKERLLSRGRQILGDPGESRPSPSLSGFSPSTSGVQTGIAHSNWSCPALQKSSGPGGLQASWNNTSSSDPGFGSSPSGQPVLV